MTAEPASIFDGLEAVGGREPVRRERSQAYGSCPACSAAKVGLVRSPDGKHLMWRMHNLKTHAGTSMPCHVSAQRLCTDPARRVIGYVTPVCPHEK